MQNAYGMTLHDLKGLFIQRYMYETDFTPVHSTHRNALLRTTLLILLAFRNRRVLPLRSSQNVNYR